MANRDSAFGFKVVKSAEAPVQMIMATGQTVAVGDPVTFELTGVTLATASSEFVHGVIVPQENASGVHKTYGENLFTTSTAGQTVAIQRATGASFAAQCSGSTTAIIRGATVDIEGTTGAVEVNENAQSVKVFTIDHVLNGEPFGDQVVALGANGIVIGRFVAESGIDTDT